jgi:CelD/BcsL family acetyltransferase involved in cellulose biosynthesis
VPPSLGDEVLAFEPCLVVEVPAGAGELRDVLPSKIRNNLGYFRRRAERAGRVSFETATAATLPAFVEALFRLHDARWQHVGQPGVLADPAIRRFHRRAAPLLQSSGLLRLHALRLDERIVAVMYALHARDRAYCYLCGFDPECGALSPGTLILGHSIRQAVGEGAREVDFLRGQERFKYFWGVRARPCYGRMLTRVG